MSQRPAIPVLCGAATAPVRPSYLAVLVLACFGFFGVFAFLSIADLLDLAAPETLARADR